MEIGPLYTSSTDKALLEMCDQFVKLVGCITQLR